LLENRQFVPTPPSFNALARGDPLRILGWTWYPQKLEWRGRTMWTQSTSVTDRQTDGQTDRITITNTVQRIASHGKNSFTGTLCGKFAMTLLLNILPYLNCVVKYKFKNRYNCNKYICKKTFIFWNIFLLINLLFDYLFYSNFLLM